jgi:hypothetical protein
LPLIKIWARACLLLPGIDVTKPWDSGDDVPATDRALVCLVRYSLQVEIKVLL